MLQAKLPRLMVAINGARRQKHDHAHIPITIDEILSEVAACIKAGADGFHIHCRDQDGKHSLDIQLNKALWQALSPFQDKAYIQLTSEQAGLYGFADQMALLQAVRPARLSAAFREVMSAASIDDALGFYRFAHDHEIDLQHIIYSPQELADFLAFWTNHFGHSGPLKLLFVLGNYQGQESQPDMINDFLAVKPAIASTMDWAVCAFGVNETKCLAAAHALGGKMRVGFENSTCHEDGTTAPTNAARVQRLLGVVGDP